MDINIRNINIREDGFTKVTPELAAKWLNQNTNNRRIRRAFVDELVKKIQNNQWVENTPDHIAFYDDGTLANGQHRLTAIAEAGVPVYTKIEYDIPRDAAICIDAGKKRTFSDNVQIVLGEKFYTQQISNMMRTIFEGGKAFSHEQHLILAKHYKKDIMFVQKLYEGANKHLKKTDIIAATFAALQAGVDQSALISFAASYTSGKIPEKDNYNYDIVIAYRDYILTSASVNRVRTDRANSIKLAEYVIDKFLTNKPGRITKSIDKWVYPKLNLTNVVNGEL